MTRDERDFVKAQVLGLFKWFEQTQHIGTRRDIAILVGQVADMVRDDYDRAEVAARRKAVQK